MLSNNKAFSSVYRLQRTLLTVFYIVSVIAIYCVIAYVLIHILHAGFFIVAASVIIYVVLTVLFGSFMTVISYIPSNLAGAFDPIKNDIANRRISTSRDFSERLVGFINEFFDFAFMDVEHSLVKIGREEPSRSFPDKEIDLEAMDRLTADSHEVVYQGRITIGPDRLYCYIVPIRFGGERLGFFCVFTKTKLMRIFVDLLAEFESSFVDDQLMHVLDYQEGTPK
jgi:hypothetical protein